MRKGRLICSWHEPSLRDWNLLDAYPALRFAPYRAYFILCLRHASVPSCFTLIT